MPQSWGERGTQLLHVSELHGGDAREVAETAISGADDRNSNSHGAQQRPRIVFEQRGLHYNGRVFQPVFRRRHDADSLPKIRLFKVARENHQIAV